MTNTVWAAMNNGAGTGVADWNNRQEVIGTNRNLWFWDNGWNVDQMYAAGTTTVSEIGSVPNGYMDQYNTIGGRS